MDRDRGGLEGTRLGLIRVIGSNDEKICEDFLTGSGEGRCEGCRHREEKREGLEDKGVRSSLIVFLPSEVCTR